MPNGREDNNTATMNGDDSDNPPSIIWPLFLTFKWPFMGAVFYKLIYDLLQFTSPQLLKQLIAFIEDQSQPMWKGIGIGQFFF